MKHTHPVGRVHRWMQIEPSKDAFIAIPPNLNLQNGDAIERLRKKSLDAVISYELNSVLRQISGHTNNDKFKPDID